MAPQNISSETEIRKIPDSIYKNIKELAAEDSVFDLLMRNIPNNVDDPASGYRFSDEDIKWIRKERRTPFDRIETLLNEWGTMGENRPKVQHLLSLFVKCKFFRVADFVAKLISAHKPERPQKGPAARIDISLPNEIEIPDLNQRKNNPEEASASASFGSKSFNMPLTSSLMIPKEGTYVSLDDLKKAMETSMIKLAAAGYSGYRSSNESERNIPFGIESS